MIRDLIHKAISQSVGEALGDISFSVERTEDFEHGDYATNVALVVAKQVKKAPVVFAKELVAELQRNLPEGIEKIEVAGAGFINFFLSRKYLSDAVSEIISAKGNFGKNKNLAGKKVMVEYTDPNPFKEFHIGHLMSNTIGESIARLFEAQGAEVKRACYQGDVGLHVAKAIWGMQSVPIREGTPLEKLDLTGKARYLGHAYALGAAAYEDGHKEDINGLNKKIYDRSDSEVNKLYDWGRKVSLEYFETQYKKLGTKFDFYFFESEMAEAGVSIVKKFLEKGIFETSEGAIVFHGEKYNPKLHTRVYITSQGIPTYEAKELGLHLAKEKKYPSDISVVITANEQDAVFTVGLEAFKQIDPKLAEKVKHLSHGMLRLPSGKMSSRSGDVITADALVSQVHTLVEEKIKDRDYDSVLKKTIGELVSIGAIKYSILRQAIGGDIVFDFDKSISFEGDSGPYLQYASTRAQSALSKAENEGVSADVQTVPTSVFALERTLVHFSEIVERAGKEYAPHHLVTYLIELAGTFNNFYANEKIVDKSDSASAYKIALTKAFRMVMETGLSILGVQIPEKM
ncbi:MAG: arginine--tRNA ligase [Candidatus Taylorbacteria bacterium RIFCSPHIGHO2_01_FULL_46_22b]|uniref:Arginine--tRNA ligase n=1 Tax=Candidatus Taylorbacteria bacterium RIFCSPHIGHO2_01_FULL_46_22b TaxID=1802301 RepID=A0A1G2M4D1_9BACT|nr:MAG: arginine--tRNA ligase [Candidatus Taylorbacteria bacterium RIFCSPHIGHO2_01_FULL_46_22b]